MPKQLEVLPDRLSRSGRLSMPVIPVFAYDTALTDECVARGEDTLKEVLRHMLLLREFETMLNSLRSKGEYGGISCQYRGPAHLSVGQEASAVGMALALSPEDHIFGNHRSHGDFLAKGLSAINRLSENVLGEKMAAHDQGRVLKLVEHHLGGDWRMLSENFLLFGFLSEILMRATGFNGGMGGSMHAFFPPFGAYPNNAIVGGSAGIAAGAAIRKRHTGDGIALSISGDGSTGCGPVWEAMNFASMAQFDTLWKDAEAKGLPVLFFFNNNFYAMGGQTDGETMGWERLSRIGAGVNADAMHAETVDGTRPLAVADAVARKRTHLLAGNGPALLDIECYRYSGHSTSDANAYRSREELKAWQAHDPISRYSAELVEAGVMSQLDIENMTASVHEQIVKVTEIAGNPAIAPAVDIAANPNLIGSLMFNHTSIEIAETKASRSFDLEACSRIRQNSKKSRHGFDHNGKTLSPMRAITLRDGLFESILYHMLRDERLIAYGEECREWGGAFGVYRGLSDLFPHERLFNSPISEAAIVATAVGYAMEGGRALVELMYADFIGRAGDEILNQMAKWQAMSGGELSIPVVLRCSVGSKYGAQHSQDWTSLIAHVPGLKVLYPATPADAKGLMASALSSNDPVVFFESQRLYDVTEQFQLEGVPADYYELPMGEPDIKCEGDAVTVLTIGPCLYPAIEAAKVLAKEHSVSAEVIDARSLVPFNYDPVIASVKKTGRILIVSEACERGSFAMTLSANISRFAFGELKAPVRVLGAPNWIVPGVEMESTYFPQSVDIVDVITADFYPVLNRTRQGVRDQDTQALAKAGL
ncbi:dehydrogenase [Chromatiales bacterium (ex Bugula neritina AB1)]|nr:dehydrogenase [Chromatiales bacterium (ex Bugula neritina AB1)]